jgi:hypothetical protein
LAVSFVEGQPRETHSVGHGAIQQLQGDVSLGPMRHCLGNAAGSAALAVGRPILGKEQFPVEQGMEAVGGGIAQVDGDAAVVGLARRPAVLAFDARRLVSLLGVAGLVEDAHGVRVGMIAGDDLLEAVAHRSLPPTGAGQKLLERARGRAGIQRNRLDAFPRQIAQLPSDIRAKVLGRLDPTEAVIEFGEITIQRGSQRGDLRGIHAGTPCKGTTPNGIKYLLA